MHNLVVYPRTDGKQTKYVLLSGERRYKALNYLQARGDAKWNTVKNCRVVTTPLSDNEKKVMLLSANLQVRGGFANEINLKDEMLLLEETEINDTFLNTCLLDTSRCV